MKKLLLLISVIFTGLTGNCQVEESADGVITLGILQALPTGDFRKTDITKPSGFAKSGGSQFIRYTQLFKNRPDSVSTIRLGSSITFINRNNDLDAQEMANAFAPAGTETETTYNSGYNTRFILAGFLINNHLAGSLFTSSLRINAGMAFNTFPEYQYTFTGGKPGILQPETKVNAFAYGFDAGLQYRLKKFALGIEASWLFTRPEVARNGKKEIQALNSMGAGFTLGYLLNYSPVIKL